MQTARELTQDVFMEFYQQKDRMAGIDHFKAYLFSMAKHKVLNYYRQQLMQKKYRESVLNEGMEAAPASALDTLEKKELLGIVKEKIAALPPKCREVFLLSREEKLSYSAIASRLSISENTVDQHMRKALRVIRLALKEYDAAALNG